MIGKIMKVCILLRSGELFGPFDSRDAALEWCYANFHDGYSTYDLWEPIENHDDQS